MSDLHIPAPCHESWETMRPVTNGRHCASCNHAVVDVTNMAVAEGRRVLAELTATLHREPSRRTCVRAHATPTGRLVPGRRKLLTTALAAMLASTMAGCVGDGPELGKTQEAVPPPQTHEIHPVPPGRIAFVPTPPLHDHDDASSTSIAFDHDHRLGL